jgi:hypothetical protein
VHLTAQGQAGAEDGVTVHEVAVGIVDRVAHHQDLALEGGGRAHHRRAVARPAADLLVHRPVDQHVALVLVELGAAGGHLAHHAGAGGHEDGHLAQPVGLELVAELIEAEGAGRAADGLAAVATHALRHEDRPHVVDVGRVLRRLGEATGERRGEEEGASHRRPHRK